MAVKIYKISYLSLVLDKSRISSHTLVEEERIINTKFGEEKPEFPKNISCAVWKGLKNR
jgi:hypothetical protein